MRKSEFRETYKQRLSMILQIKFHVSCSSPGCQCILFLFFFSSIHDNSSSLCGQGDMTPPASSYGYLSPPVIDQVAKNNVKIDLNKAMYSSADTLETQGTGVMLSDFMDEAINQE